MIERLKTWAARQIEKRLRSEWEQYRQNPEVRLGTWRRSRGNAPHVTRSLIQINFHRDR